MVERCTVNANVLGSIPSLSAMGPDLKHEGTTPPAAGNGYRFLNETNWGDLLHPCASRITANITGFHPVDEGSIPSLHSNMAF